MEKKITKAEMFAIIKGLLADNDDVVAFCDHEIELLAKKSANKKATKTQEANKELKTVILDTFATSIEDKATVTELMNANAELGALSNQKVSAILRLMVADGTIVRTVDKKKTYFSVS